MAFEHAVVVGVVGVVGVDVDVDFVSSTLNQITLRGFLNRRKLTRVDRNLKTSCFGCCFLSLREKSVVISFAGRCWFGLVEAKNISSGKKPLSSKPNPILLLTVLFFRLRPHCSTATGRLKPGATSKEASSSIYYKK